MLPVPTWMISVNSRQASSNLTYEGIVYQLSGSRLHTISGQLHSARAAEALTHHSLIRHQQADLGLHTGVAEVRPLFDVKSVHERASGAFLYLRYKTCVRFE
jgi:hypothetical protein